MGGVGNQAQAEVVIWATLGALLGDPLPKRQKALSKEGREQYEQSLVSAPQSMSPTAPCSPKDQHGQRDTSQPHHSPVVAGDQLLQAPNISDGYLAPPIMNSHVKAFLGVWWKPRDNTHAWIESTFPDFCS